MTTPIPQNAMPDVPLTPLSVAALKRRLVPGTRYHLTYRANRDGLLSFKNDDLPNREVLVVQSRDMKSMVIGGEATWLAFPVAKNGDTLHATPDGFQISHAGRNTTMRFAWGDARDGARVNAPLPLPRPVPEVGAAHQGA